MIKGRVTRPAALRATKVDDAKVFLSIAMRKEVTNIRWRATTSTANTNAVSGEKGGGCLAFDDGVCAPR